MNNDSYDDIYIVSNTILDGYTKKVPLKTMYRTEIDELEVRLISNVNQIINDKMKMEINLNSNISKIINDRMEKIENDLNCRYNFSRIHFVWVKLENINTMIKYINSKIKYIIIVQICLWLILSGVLYLFL